MSRPRLASMVASLLALALALPGLSASAAVLVPATPQSRAVASALVDEGTDGLWRLDATGWPAPPAVDGTSWILVDVTTGQILDGLAADVPRPPASTTKLLTALAVSRRSNPGDIVAVGDEVLGLEGASVGLRPGDRMSVDDMLALLLLRSGNDAAVALAVHAAGTEDAFGAILRDEAAVLGLMGAVVSEPHGLFDDNRLSARSLAVIGRAVLADPRLRPLVGASTWVLEDGTTITNRNELLAGFPGATGLKTGQTRAAGWSLVASARRGQRHLVAVVLGGGSASGRFTSSAALLEHGFNAFAQAPATPALRVRGEGRWLEVVGGRLDGLLPVGSVPTLVPALPVEPDPPVVQWRWETAQGVGALTSQTRLASDSRLVAAAPVRWRWTAEGREGDTAALGAWLAGRVQAGMRAATVADIWR